MSDLTMPIAIVYFSFLGQGSSSATARSISDRIIIFSVFLTGGLFFWTYSAGLVSFLTVEKLEFPIETIEVRKLIFKLQMFCIIYTVVHSVHESSAPHPPLPKFVVSGL